MAVPETIWLYRITHIDNLEYDLQHGLHISTSLQANPNYHQIGDSTLIDYRKQLLVPDPPGGSLGDYIPFYLGPRSPMLFQIATGWEDVQRYPQEEIIYYISSVAKIKEHNLEYFFTDGHARSMTSTKYTDDNDFDKLDWDTIGATYWKSDDTDLRRKEKKQSELLVKTYMPPACIQYIGVRSNTIQKNVLNLLANLDLRIPVRVSPQRLYYDHL